MKTIRLDLLLDILSLPTAPFREGRIIKKVLEVLSKNSIPHFCDPIGNIVIGATSQKEYLKLIQKTSEEPLRVFIAHMDHPGFHGSAWTPSGDLQVKWHGGTPTKHLEGARVWIADQNTYEGILLNTQLIPSGRAIDQATVRFIGEKPSLPSVNAKSLYGGFRFKAPVWQEGELLRTQAADDLVGVFSILSLALDYWKSGKKKSGQFLGLLTRAEEVGFIGAIGHFELGWLARSKRKILCVSLETSRTLPGAEIGKGPVVRLGDRFTVFDPAALNVFSNLAQKVLPQKHQKRIMDGGTCEGTAATVYGFQSIGISVPLGNYHNQSLEGGPESSPENGPAPEFVHIQDVSSLIQLCHALIQPGIPWQDPWTNKKKEFKKEFKRYQALLKSGP